MTVGSDSRPWALVAQCGAALAASVGVGRFALTPILPLMLAQAGLAPHDSALLATANYAGYLVGAVAGILAPGLLRLRWSARVAGIVMVASLAGMAATSELPAWLALRFVAGVASALVFVIAVDVALGRFRGREARLAGWAFGGIGAGIALTGALVLAISQVAGWQAAWLIAAALAAALVATAWRMPVPDPPPTPAVPAAAPSDGRRRIPFAAVLAGYSLEGAGYIIAGTFLVVAIGQTVPAALASASWIVVGLAALPSSALFAWLGFRRSRSGLLAIALAAQAIGVALPALAGGAGFAAVSAVLFGGTFVGIGTLSLGLGKETTVRSSVALLTAGYGLGQVLGPLVAAPFLSSGYRGALVASAVIIAVAALVVAGSHLPIRRRAAPGPDAP